jgi:hypothetical protein
MKRFLGKGWQSFRVTVNKRFPLFAPPTLHLLFSPKSIPDMIVFFPIHKSYRQPFGCVTGAYAFLVLVDSSFQVPGGTNIVRAIAAFQNIHPSHNFFQLGGFDTTANEPPSTQPPNIVGG